MRQRIEIIATPPLIVEPQPLLVGAAVELSSVVSVEVDSAGAVSTGADSAGADSVESVSVPFSDSVPFTSPDSVSVEPED